MTIRPAIVTSSDSVFLIVYFDAAHANYMAWHRKVTARVIT